MSISDRFRTVVEEESSRESRTSLRRSAVLGMSRSRIACTAIGWRKRRLNLRSRAKGPLVRAEARDGDKFAAFEMAIDKLIEQVRRAKDKRVKARIHPKRAHFEKETGALEGIDVKPAPDDVIQAVATGVVPVVQQDEEEEYSPVVIRTKEFEPEWMTVEEAVDRMELVGHDFFLFIDSRSDHPSVVYRRRGWDYGVISLTTQTQPEVALAG